MLVAREVERMILAGELSVGERVNESALAARFRVSRGPVREALRGLEESGLLRLEKNRGVFVREISLAEADEIYDLREALDELVGRRLAKRFDAGGAQGGARAARRDGPRRRAGRRRELPHAQPALPRHAGGSHRQRQARSPPTGA